MSLISSSLSVFFCHFAFVFWLQIWNIPVLLLLLFLPGLSPTMIDDWCVCRTIEKPFSAGLSKHILCGNVICVWQNINHRHRHRHRGAGQVSGSGSDKWSLRWGNAPAKGIGVISEQTDGESGRRERRVRAKHNVCLIMMCSERGREQANRETEWNTV